MQNARLAVYGNLETVSRIISDVGAATFPHAVLLEGKEGSGRRTMARAIAMALLCTAPEGGAPCGKCNACEKVASRQHTDVTYLGKEDGRATIGVESVRRLRREIHLAPNEAERKVYIIEDAHTMTEQAQNALLVMLEEPPPNVFLLLLAESADAMLVTVRSRVRLYRMQRFRPHEIDRYLMQESPEAVRKKAERPEEYEAILQGADGCIGAALALLDPTKAEHLLVTKRTVESLLDALRGTSFVPIYQATAALPTSRAELSLVLESFAMALRDLALIKKIKEPHLCFFSKKEEAEAAAGGLTLSKILHVSEGIEQCLEGLERNANVALLLTDLRDLFKSS